VTGSRQDLPLPPTRWSAEAASDTRYLERFSTCIETGVDIDGEARLADALVKPGARILDAGSGMGRVGIALLRRGHDVLAAEPDPTLVAESQRRWPELPVLTKDILQLDPAAQGSFDLILLVGNVLILIAEGTEVRVLTTLRRLLAPGGRILVGFHAAGGPPHGRQGYSWDEFSADVATAGLRAQHHFGGYSLEPAGTRSAGVPDGAEGEFCVAILAAD